MFTNTKPVNTRTDGFTVLKNAISPKVLHSLLSYAEKMLKDKNSENGDSLATVTQTVPRNKLPKGHFVVSSAGPRRRIRHIKKKAYTRLVERVITHFGPPQLSAMMIQTYDAGSVLPPHVDGYRNHYLEEISYKKVVILNLKGTAYFHLGGERKKVGPGDVIILERKALNIKHGVPRMSEDRTNIVLRWRTDDCICS